MRSVTAAAGGQRCAVVVTDGEGQRSQSEDKGQKDGESAPHLD